MEQVSPFDAVHVHLAQRNSRAALDDLFGKPE